MKPKTMIFLLALLGTCLIFIVLRGGYRRGGRPAVEIAPAKSIFPSVPESLKELVITAADGSRMAFVKDGGQWRITEPIKAKAGNIVLSDMAESIADLRQAVGEQKEPLDDDVTGLANPQWTIKITDVAGRTHTIQVGLPTPLSKGDRTFIRLDGGLAVVAAMDFKAALDRPVADFRDKSLWDAASSDIARIDVRGKDRYELIRRDSAWLLTAANVSAPADKDKVRLLTDKLKYLNVEEFVDDRPANLAIYGLDEPRLIIGFGLAGPKAAIAPASLPASAPASRPARRYALALGNAAGNKVYAKLMDQPAVFLLEGTALNDLGPRMNDIRDRQLLHLIEEKISAIEIDRGGGKISLAQQDGNWQMTAPFAGKANDAAVGELLRNVSTLKADGFEDAAAPLAVFGLDKPALTIEVAGGGEVFRVAVSALGPGKGASRYATTSAFAGVAILSGQAVEGLNKSLKDFKD